MELRRSTSASYKESRQYISKHRESSSPHQSLTSSVEVQGSIAEEEFVVIESGEVDGSNASSQKSLDVQNDFNTRISVDENDNSVSATARPKSLTVGVQTSQDDKADEARVNGVINSPVTTQVTPTQHVNTKINTSISTSTAVSVHEQQCMRQGLSLSFPSVCYVAKRSSPSDCAGTPAKFPALKTTFVGTKASDRSDSSSLSSEGAYYLPDNTTQHTPVCFDLDKISPPPSYQIASQIFNSQKPGVKTNLNENLIERKTDFADQRTSGVDLVNGSSSQDSSFEEVESVLPVVLSNSGRESIGIEEHIMRYMTKKYSEPRLQTGSSRSGGTVSVNNGPRLHSPGATTSVYLGSPASASDRSFMVQSPIEGILSREADCPDGVSNKRKFSAYNRSESQKDREVPTPSGQSSIADMLAVCSVQARKKNAEQSSRYSMDCNNELVVPNGIEALNTSFRVTPVSQSRKSISASRLARFHRQRAENENSLENMRRAASSPSVNSEHERCGSTESQTEITSLTKRANNKRGPRMLKDDSFDRRKSIDSGSLRKLAAELQANQTLCDNFPMLSKLLGGAGLQELQKPTNLPRYRSSDTLHGEF